MTKLPLEEGSFKFILYFYFVFEYVDSSFEPIISLFRLLEKIKNISWKLI